MSVKLRRSFNFHCVGSYITALEHTAACFDIIMHPHNKPWEKCDHDIQGMHIGVLILIIIYIHKINHLEPNFTMTLR